MPIPGRLRWTLTVLAALALAGAVLLIAFSPSGPDDLAVAPERQAPADPRGPLLQGRADRETGTDATSVTRPPGVVTTLHLLAPGGGPATGAAVSYRAFDQSRDPIHGRTDTAGILTLAPRVAGQRCEVIVEAGADWSAKTFDVWADSEVTLRLEGGCRVWFEVGPDDMHRMGQVLRYSTWRQSSGSSMTSTITIAATRTLLGRFVEDLCIHHLGWTQAASSIRVLVLPPTGDVTVLWAAKPAPTDFAWLRLRGPEGSTAPPRVTFGSPTSEVNGWEEFSRRSEPGALVLAVAPGRHSVLATAEGSWAFQKFDAKANEAPVDVPLTWTRGGALEVRLPVEASGPVHLFVARFPGSEQDVDSMGVSLDSPPGVLAFDSGFEEHTAGEWPAPASRPDPRTYLWDGLPRGATVNVVVPTDRWGTLKAFTQIPSEGERAVLDVPLGTRVTVRAVVAGAPDPEVWVEVTPKGGTAERTRTVGATASVTGLLAGTSIRIQLREAQVKGEATAIVEDGLEVRVPVVRRPQARYRARVVDEAGAPVAGVCVSFGADFDVGTTARTGPDGWAEVVTASDRVVIASAAGPGHIGRERVPEGGEVTLTMPPQRSVWLVFDVGERIVQIDESFHGERAGSGTLQRSCRVFPGSTCPLLVPSRTTNVHLVVRSIGAGESDVLFDREIDLGDAATTTLRVTR